MTCKKCGAELEEGVSVCPECGEIVGEEPEVKEEITEETVTQEPVTEESVTEEPAAEEVAAEETAPEAPAAEEAPAKKKSKALPIAIAVIALAVIGVVVFLLCGGKKLFEKSPEKYLNAAAEKTFAEMKESDNGISGMLSTGNRGEDAKVTVKINDGILSGLGLFAEGEKSPIPTEISAEVSADYVDGNLKSDISLNLGAQPLTGTGYMSKDGIFIDVPALFDKPLYRYVPGFAGLAQAEQPESSFDMQAIEEAVKLASEKAPEILERYTHTLIDNLEGATKTEEDITVGDITAKCTVFTYKSNFESEQKLLKAVGEEIKADKDIKAIAAAFGFEYTDEDVDGAIDEMIEADKDIKDEDRLAFRFYVDENDKLAGIGITDGETDLRLIVLTNEGKKSGEFSRKGENVDLGIDYTYADGKSKFTVSYDDCELVKLTVENLSEGEKIAGKFTLSGGKDLAKFIADMTGEEADEESESVSGLGFGMLSTMSLSCEYEIEGNAGKAEFGVAMLGQKLVTLTEEVTMREAKSFDIPDKESCVNIADEEAMASIGENLSLEKLQPYLPEALYEIIAQLENPEDIGEDIEDVDDYAYLYDCWGYDEQGELHNMGQWYIDEQREEGLYVKGDDGQLYDPWQEDAFYYHDENGTLYYVPYDESAEESGEAA